MSCSGPIAQLASLDCTVIDSSAVSPRMRASCATVTPLLAVLEGNVSVPLSRCPSLLLLLPCSVSSA